MSLMGMPLGAYADGDGEGPASVASPVSVLAENPGLIPNYLMIAEPYDPSTAGLVSLYYSMDAFTSAASDDPPNQVFVDDRIVVPISLSSHLALERGTLRTEGTKAGDIELWTMDKADAIIATDITFTAPNIISTTATNLSALPVGKPLSVFGSASNDGDYVVATVGATSITVEGSGISNETAGAEVTLASRGIDDLAGYSWDGRDLRVLIGFPGYTLAQCSEIFSGTAEGAAWTRETIRIRVRSHRFRLERDIQTTLYEGAVSVTGSDIGFSSPDTITSMTTDLSVFVAGRLIEVVGSAANDSFLVVGSSTATSMTLSGGTVSTEAAGASVTLRIVLEGGAELEGKCKPLLWGQVRQSPLALVNSLYLIYQAHDGSIEAVDAVRDRGVALVFDADYGSGRLLAGATVSAGEYATCLAEGLIRLGASPSGIPTGDIRGDNAGGYVSSVADVIRRIATTKGPLVDPDDLDVGSLVDLNAETTAAVGVRTGLETEQTDAVLDKVANSVGAFIDFTATGRLRVRQLEDPTTATATAVIDSIEPTSWSGGNFDIPAHEIKLRYRRYPQTLSGEEAASSLDADTRLDFGQEYRDTTEPETDADSEAVLDQHPSAALYEVVTLLDTAADASAEAARRFALYSPTRHRYDVDAWDALYTYQLGDVVTLKMARYDLTEGKKFVIIGIDEAPVTSSGHVNSARLVLWGRED